MLKISVMSNPNPNWPFQDRFIKLVKSWAEASGYVTAKGAVNIPAVAPLFNISESTLKQALYYKGKRRLGYDRLVFISGVIGCNIQDLTGAPSASPVPGISQNQWLAISEGDKVFVSSILDDLVRDALTNPEKALLFGVYRDLKERLLRLRK